MNGIDFDAEAAAVLVLAFALATDCFIEDTASEALDEALVLRFFAVELAVADRVGRVGP